MKKSFSIIEIIFTIVIIAIISSFALNKYFHHIEKVNFVKIKSEVSLINNAINQLYSNQTLLGNNNFIIERLDEALVDVPNETLFNGYNEFILLDEVILSTSEEKKELGQWIKLSNSEYKVYFSKDKFLSFYLDSENMTFACDRNENLCIEFEQ